MVPVLMLVVVVLVVVVLVIVVLVIVMLVVVRSVLVMLMVMIVMIVQNHVEVAPGDAAGTFPRHAVMESLQTEAGKDRIQLFPAAAEVEQCGDGHIAADSRGALQVQNFFHRHTLPCIFAGVYPLRGRKSTGEVRKIEFFLKKPFRSPHSYLKSASSGSAK